ncbi:MAG: hypothetical protein QM757_21415 [Paludibaculum sp.]
MEQLITSPFLLSAALALAGVLGAVSLLRSGEEEARRQRERQRRKLALAVYLPAASWPVNAPQNKTSEE